MGTYPLTASTALLAGILTTLSHFHLASSSRISHFAIINTDTNTPIRRLHPSDVLSFDHTFAFEAVIRPEPSTSTRTPSSQPARVTFTHPYLHIERYAPFSFPGDLPRGVFKPLNLAPGRHLLSAYADGDLPSDNLTVSFSVRPPHIPDHGPFPWELVPRAPRGENHDVPHIPVPRIAAPCDRHSPSVALLDAKPATGARRFAFSMVQFNVTWCSTPSVVRGRQAGHELRVRILSYTPERLRDGDDAHPHTKAETESRDEDAEEVEESEMVDDHEVKEEAYTTVLYAAVHADMNAPRSVELPAPCGAQLVFVEVCGSHGEHDEHDEHDPDHDHGDIEGELDNDAHIVCGTSALRTLPSRRPRPPRLFSRAPLRLALTTNDAPVVQYALARGRSARSRAVSYLLSIAVVARDGYFLGASPWVARNDSTPVVARLPLRQRRRKGNNHTHSKGHRDEADHGDGHDHVDDDDDDDDAAGEDDELSGVEMQYDGATSFLRFAEAGCPRAVGSFRLSEATRIAVRRAGASSRASLAEQDTILPAVGGLRFPPTPHGESVSLRATVLRRGDGLRGDGTATQLQFEWRRWHGAGPREAGIGGGEWRKFEAIDGESEPVLRLHNVTCAQAVGHGAAQQQVAADFIACSGSGRGRGAVHGGCKQGQVGYSVVVCNSLGCVFSNVVRPAVVAPVAMAPGMRWNEHLCREERM